MLVAAFARVRRFLAFRQALGLAPDILSGRLRRLVEAQVLAHIPAQERSNATEKGDDLFPAILIKIPDIAGIL